MRRWLRRLFTGLAVVVLLVGGWFVWLMTLAGEFRPLTPHFAGSCTPVAGVVGAEDLTIHPRTGVAYLSACDRRALAAGGRPNGAIYAYDLTAASPRPVNLTLITRPGFCPHGISLYVAPDGADVLFVVNHLRIDHTRTRHTIEVYDLKNGMLLHRTTMADPLLVAPNDVVAVTPTQFYVTNDHRYPSGRMRTIEDYGRRPWANVVMWNGKEFREVVGGIRLANGINVSRDGRTVYVAASIGRSVGVYDRDPTSGALTLRDEIALGSGPDNIEMDGDGSLWIAAHPRLLTLVRYMSGARPLAPSQVLHVVPGDHRVDEVFLDLGEQLSGASVAAVHGKRLLIGPIADSKFLDCQMR